MMPRQARRPRDGQRGLAALIVVMLLFFVVSLAAAYSSRNLIFEQRTSGNQARSTLAFEAAEAGIEWALSQLNGGAIDGSCDPTVGALSFQQRYLRISPTPGATQGFVQQTLRTTDLSPRVWPTCVFNGTAWNCACPGATNADPTAPTGTAQFPAFRVWPATLQSGPAVTSPWVPPASPRPGFLPLTSIGCTRLPTADETVAGNRTCLDFSPQSQAGEGQAELRTMLALRSGLGVPPAAAITARLDFVPDPASGAANVIVSNTDASGGGYTINTGNALVATKVAAVSLAGTPGAASYAENDARLLNFATVSSGASSVTAPILAAGERMFVSIFGMNRQTYRNQTGLRVCPSPCTSAAIITLLADNPNRIIWVEGDLSLDAAIGSAPVPVLLIVNGSTLTLSAGVNLYGFVYLTGGASTTSTIELPAAATTITGAVVAEGQLMTHYAAPGGSGTELTVNYDRQIMDILRTTYGTWVRVTGGWRDFK
jgi:Tfp pilus assembly protein PilX